MKTYYLAKMLHKMRLTSYAACKIDKTSRVDAGGTLTKVVMGRYSYIGKCTRITDATIGSFCSIGEYCGIGGGVHPVALVSTSPTFLKGRNIMRKNFSQFEYKTSIPVTIGSDVWIGDGAFIMPGLHIGDGAVIGAHAVVTKDVAPYAIVAGVPAKELRKRFDELVIEKLLEIRWWDWPDEKLERAAGLFDSPEKLIEAWEKGEIR